MSRTRPQSLPRQRPPNGIGGGESPPRTGARADAAGAGYSKKTLAIFTASCGDHFIEEHRKQYPVGVQGEALEVSMSEYSEWREPPMSQHARSDAELAELDLAHKNGSTSDTTVGAEDNCQFVPCVLTSPLAYEQLQDGGKGDETGVSFAIST